MSFYRSGFHKFNAKKCVIDGITFPSLKEGRMYSELKLMEKAHEIEKLLLQPEFILQEGYTTVQGKKIQPIKYRADFSFYDKRQKRFRILDAKGFKTPVYLLKKKLFDHIMKDRGIELEETI